MGVVASGGEGGVPLLLVSLPWVMPRTLIQKWSQYSRLSSCPPLSSQQTGAALDVRKFLDLSP